MRKFTRVTTLLMALMLLASSVCPALALEVELHGYSKSNGYEYVTLGSYPTEADGTEKPILWRVLRADSGEAWLLSEYVLFGSPVHGDYEHYQGWEKSDLYMYLNSTFIYNAFTAEERAVLLNRTEDNALVTLITSDEMKDASIGFSSNTARLCESTAWAKILPDPPIFELPKTNNKGRWKPLYIYSKGHKYSPWWSRTRSVDYPHEQRRVMDEGKIGRISTGNSDLGVRPTVYVNLNALSIASGNGSMASPYQLVPAGSAVSVSIPEAPVQAAPIEQEAPVQQTPVVQEPVVEVPEIDLPDNNTNYEDDEFLSDDPDLLENMDLEQVGDDFYPTDDDDLEPVAEPVSDGFTGTVDPATIHEKFPALTAQGFLPEGQSEFVYANENEGLWLYASQTLRIQIEKFVSTNQNNKPANWYEAQIYVKDLNELFDLYPFDKDHYKSYGDRYKTDPYKIAVQHQLVFAINTDYFIYRVERDHEESFDYPLGVIIRNGEVLGDRPKKAGTTVYPPLDVMAFYPDGTVSLHENATINAKELLAKGAVNTLSFGPILVENGAVSPRASQFGSTLNPRTAFGVVEPGHYAVVLVEGKANGGEGQSCAWMAEKMAELGCQEAMNLDGGDTAVMLFMGKKINVNKTKNGRPQNELFGIGHSSAVQ